MWHWVECNTLNLIILIQPGIEARQPKLHFVINDVWVAGYGRNMALSWAGFGQGEALAGRGYGYCIAVVARVMPRLGTSHGHCCGRIMTFKIGENQRQGEGKI